MKENPSNQDLEKKVKELEQQIEELKSNNNLLENIFALLPVGLQVFDKNGLSQRVNQRQKELLGLPNLEEGIRKFNVLTDPFSKKNKVDIVYKKVYNGETVRHEHEYNFDFPDNQWKTRKGKRYFQETIFPILDSQSQVNNVVAILSDITEDKETKNKLSQSEENFRAFFNTINDFLFVLDDKGSIIAANQTVFDRLGYSPDELIGKSVLNVHPEELRPEAVKIIAKMLAGETAFCPIPLQSKTGNNIPVETRVTNGTWNGESAIFGVSKDISELRLSEEKFSKFFQINPALCSITEIESGKIIDVNNAFLTKLGFTKKEVVGKTSYEIGIISNNEASKILVPLKKYGFVRDFEIVLSCKNGKSLNVIANTEDIYVQDKLIHFSAMQDITQLKQTEKKLIEDEQELIKHNKELEDLNDEFSQITLILQENLIELQQAKDQIEENEAKFKKLFNSAPDPIFIIEKGTGIIADINNKLIDKYGYAVDELIGNPNTIISAEPEETLKFNANPRDFVPLRYHRKKNGEVFPVEISSALIQIQNKDYVIARVRDISERIKSEQILKESEQRFRSIFDNAISGIAFSDSNQNLLITNRALDKMFGYEKGELVGFNIDNLLHPDEAPISTEVLIDQMQKETGGFKVERRYITKQKTTIWVEISGSIIKDKEGKPNFFVGVVNDITKKKEAENQLKELIATKNKIFSIIAHDLKNPFNAILGMSSLLNESVEKRDINQAIEFSKVINIASQQALNLLENLLDWSRSQTGSIRFNPIPLNFQSLLNECLALLENSANQKGITIKQAVEPYLKVYADKNMLSTVIRNLLSNSIKYSNFDSEIYITAITLKNMIKFSVSDKGIGISKDNISNLFNPKSHALSPGTNKEKGTGLGLILCKDFIHRHKGEIWVESELNKGTTIYFTLPKYEQQL